MNILVLYGRAISEFDSGASRVMVCRVNYLVNFENTCVYTTYKHLSRIDPKIIEIPVYLDFEEVHKIIISHNIDILAVPGGEAHSAFAYNVVKGTHCKIVTEMHSKPGYESINLGSCIRIWGKLSLKNRIVSYFKLALLPLYRIYIKKRALRNFQNASLMADKLVVLADSFIEEYRNQYDLPNAKNIVAIGNPLSFDTFADEKQIEAKDRTILVVSRLDETSKRISIAIKAWKVIEELYPDWRMEIVGSGDSELLYRNMIAKLGLTHVSLCGHQNPESYYERASIFLMTSAYEGWGMTITEALQKGCVPVAMNSYSALGYIVNNGQDGFITPNNDINSFVDKIIALIEQPELRKKMAMAGVINSKRFLIENIGKQWVDLYKSLIQ